MQDTESLESEFDDGHNDSRADDQYMRDEEEFLECANDGCIYNITEQARELSLITNILTSRHAPHRALAARRRQV